MFCLAGLIIFAIMGIFSATHRQLAKEAAVCVFRRITLRPCTVGFKEKFKGMILSRLLPRSQRIARAFNKHFELFAWVFIVLSIASVLWVGKGVYNFYVYGSCSGLNKSGFCVFDPTGENQGVSAVGEVCLTEEPSSKNLTTNSLTLPEYPQKLKSAKNELIFIGCYSCDYTRKAYPIIQELLDKYDIDYTFVHFPVKAETNYLSNYGYCVYQENQDKFWKFNDLLFESEKENIAIESYALSLLNNLGLDSTKIKKCAENVDTQGHVMDQLEDIKQTGIYGTPTIFINGKAFVGPKPLRVYKRALNK